MRDLRALALAAWLLASAPASAAAAAGPVDLLEGATGPVEGESGSPRRRLALHRRRSVREGEAFQRRELGDGSKAAKSEPDVDGDDSDEDGEEECTCEEEDAHAKRFQQQLHKMKMAKQQKKHKKSRRLKHEDGGEIGVFEMEAEGLDADEEEETRRLKRKKKKEHPSKKKQPHNKKKQHHKKKKGNEESGSSKGSKQGQLGSKSKGTTKQPSNSPSGSPATAFPTASSMGQQTTAPTNGKGGKGSKSGSGKGGKGPSSSGKSGKDMTKSEGSSKSRKTKMGKSKSGKGCVCVPTRSPTVETQFPTPGRTGSPTVDPTPEPTKAPATDPPTPPPVDPPTTPNPTTPNPTTPTPATPNPTTPPPVDPPTTPNTSAPTSSPTANTPEPSRSPTPNPTTPNPSTPNPTPPPVDPSTEEPTGAPTSRPTPSPTEEPTKAPTNEPTTPAPTSSPTKSPIDGPSGTKVANVIIALDPVPAVGCRPTPFQFLSDGTTDEYICPYNTTAGPPFPPEDPPEIVVTSDPSIVTALRVYAASGGPPNGDQDPTSYTLEGRTESGDWVPIAEGDFDVAWVDAIPARNPAGASINSSYEEADGTLSHTEVQFENTDLYFAYRITFPTTRNSAIPVVRVSEVELVGVVDDSYVASVSEGLDPVPASGCEAQGTAEDGPNLDDGIISNYYCPTEEGIELPQLVVRAAPSVVTEIRVYANTFFPNRDPLDFTLEGLQDEASDTWASIADGDFDDAWIAAGQPPDRNVNGTAIASSYSTGDNSLRYGFASFPNDVAYSTYRLTFPTIRFRQVGQPYEVDVGELELVGRKTGPS